MGVLEAIILCPSYIVRKGLRHLLNNQPGVHVILEMDNAERLADELNKHQPALVFCFPAAVAEIDISRFDATTWVAITEDESEGVPEGFDYSIDIYDPPKTINDRLLDIESSVTGTTTEPAISLSDRETEVLKEVVRGLLNKEIADRLFISTHTVISHRKNITRKLGIRTVAGLTVYAILNDLISLQDVSHDDITENHNA